MNTNMKPSGLGLGDSVASPLPSDMPESLKPEPQRMRCADRSDVHHRPDIDLDHIIRAAFAKTLGGLSALSLSEAWFDWAAHLAISPGMQYRLVEAACAALARHVTHMPGAVMAPVAQADRISPRDHRFRAQDWNKWPYSCMASAFLDVENWWTMAVADVRGPTAQHKALAAFAARQILDMWSPSNFLATNPEVLAQTQREGGYNLYRGALNLVEDAQRQLTGKKPAGTEGFVPGKTVAVSRGRVVLRTRLAEIIQYEPTTAQVRPEPVVIVPAWILKYYILDLSPDNSMVRHLTDQGFTVFMISWRNPTAEDRNITFDDYRTDGVLPAIRAAMAITGAAQVHAAGYCLGGSLLTITAAAMARDGDQSLASVTLLASQADFHEAGELRLFIDESQLTMLEDLMWENGYLDGKEMVGTFNVLRSNDLIWSKMISDYLLGKRSAMLDVMAWASDATRMPYHKQADYLRSLYLNNDLAEGRFRIEGSPIAVSDIKVPMFVLGTEWDHVAPWHSVFKYHLLTDGDLTFALTNGGHNQGVIADTSRPGLHFRIARREVKASYIGPDDWILRAPLHQGAWWTAWMEWLGAHSGKLAPPPPMGCAQKGYTPQEPAPGTYVMD